MVGHRQGVGICEVDFKLPVGVFVVDLVHVHAAGHDGVGQFGDEDAAAVEPVVVVTGLGQHVIVIRWRDPARNGVLLHQ